jgi:BirA family biotin operon repressor/biotin-[acetyl-CoA-carboxylase] ligase
LIALDPLLAARGYALRHVLDIGSTNIEAKAALRAGADRLWIVADMQRAGRGRHERDWASPPGNLYASIALREPAPVASLPLMGFVAGVALVEAILSLAPGLGPRLALKWPNDVLLDGAKAAGILLEGETAPTGKPGLVIGMGVNVATVPEGLDRPAIALASAANWLTRDTLFGALQKTFAETLAVFNSGRGFATIRARWLALSLPMGQRLSVRLPAIVLEGVFAGLDAEGALRLETSQGIETILAGDVFVLD